MASLLQGLTSRRRWMATAAALLGAAAVVLSSFAAEAEAASTLFSSNVVELTAQNWKEVVLDSPHAVFVNICRVG